MTGRSTMPRAGHQRPVAAPDGVRTQSAASDAPAGAQGVSGCELRFTVPGRPVAYVRMTQGTKWQRPAQRYLAYRGELTLRAKAAGAARWPEPIRIQVHAYVRRRTFDLDNLIKCVLDGLNGVAFVDDKQVAIIQAAIALSPNDEELRVTVTRMEGSE